MLVAMSVGVTATRLTHASCWLAHVAMTKPYSEYTKQLVGYHHRSNLRYIANIAGGNHGKQTRNCQVDHVKKTDHARITQNECI